MLTGQAFLLLHEQSSLPSVRENRQTLILHLQYSAQKSLPYQKNTKIIKIRAEEKQFSASFRYSKWGGVKVVSDKQLIGDIKKGNLCSLDVLVRRYYKMVYAFIYRSVLDKPAAYDLTQEVFIKVQKSIPFYADKGSFKSWLFMIAANQCRDHFRNKEVKTQSLTDPLEDYHMTGTEQSVSSIMEKKENRKQIMRKMQDLPYDQREVIVLKYFEDMKINEIADITQVNESTVKSRLYRGIQKLSKQVDRGDFFEGGY